MTRTNLDWCEDSTQLGSGKLWSFMGAVAGQRGVDAGEKEPRRTASAVEGSPDPEESWASSLALSGH